MEENEIWKDVVGYEGMYLVSNFGRVKTIKFGRNKIIGFGVDKRGYKHVTLFKNGTRNTISIHRLVANAFIQNPSNKPQVDHIDGNPRNNHSCNLRYCTCKENLNYKTAHENRIRVHTKREGKPIIQFDLYGNYIKDWNSIKEASRSLGITREGIRDCCKGKQKSAFGSIWKYK